MVETSSTTSETRSTPAKTNSVNFKEELKGHLTEVADASVVLVKAHSAILAMKATRLAVLGVFGVLGMLAMILLGIYGFTLLDAAFRLGIDDPSRPWLAPLIRGAIYFGLPAIGMVVLWHSCVGYGGAAKEEEKVDAAAAVNGRTEVGRGI